jgi:hypothetical protein
MREQMYNNLIEIKRPQRWINSDQDQKSIRKEVSLDLQGDKPMKDHSIEVDQTLDGPFARQGVTFPSPHDEIKEQSQ